MEWLKSLVIDGAMEYVVDLSMRAEMPSKPFALDVSETVAWCVFPLLYIECQTGIHY